MTAMTAAQRVRVRKDAMAVTAWNSGWTWDQIAERCGYSSPQKAQTAVEKALASSATDMERNIARVKAVTRLEMLVGAVMHKALDDQHADQLAAVNVVRGLVSDIVRYTGASAPQEITMYSPASREFDALVAKVAAIESGLDDVEEADVVSESLSFDGVSDRDPVEDRGVGADEPGAEDGGDPVAEADGVPDHL